MAKSYRTGQDTVLLIMNTEEAKRVAALAARVRADEDYNYGVYLALVDVIGYGYPKLKAAPDGVNYAAPLRFDI